MIKYNKRSEQLFLALILMGHDVWPDKFFSIEHRKNYYSIKGNIFIHKYKAEFYTSTSFKDIKINENISITLKQLTNK